MITKIIFFAPIERMGATSEAEAEIFRAWARSEIERRFPGADVDVRAEESVIGHVAVDDSDSVDESDFMAEEEVIDFLSRLWDRCPWDAIL